MRRTEVDGRSTRDLSPWRLSALLLLTAAVAVSGVLAVAGPPAQEAEASAVLRAPVRADDTADALRTPEVLHAIARSTGVPVEGLRDDLSITEADGYRLALRYQPEAPAGARQVATESLRRVGSVLLDDAVTRADRALVAAQTDGRAVPAAERVAQGARDARDAAFDVRVETATVRRGWWTTGIATVAVLLLLAVAAWMLATRSRRPMRAQSRCTPTSNGRRQAKTPSAPSRVEPAAPALSLEQLERRLSELTHAAGTAKERAGVSG